MSKIEFAEEQETKVSTLAEAKQALHDQYIIGSQRVNTSDIGLTKEYHFTVGTEEFKMTQRAFRSLLKRLAIPPRFGMAIPEDLLGTIVKRLRSVKPQELYFFCREGTLFNLAPGTYSEPSVDGILDTLDRFKKREPALIRVGTDGVRVASIGPKRMTGAKKGDIVQVGTYVKVCHTGLPYPKASLMTYQLVCTNGSVLGRQWGETQWPLDVEVDKRLSVFNANLIDLQGREARVITGLESLTGTHMDTRSFAQTWKLTRRLVGVETADRLFGLDKEKRQSIIADYKAARKEGEDFQRLDYVPAYRVWENLTTHARELPGATSDRLMVVAGRMIDNGTGEVVE